MTLAALLNAKAFWYLTRGTGVVALLLLTASVALGVLTAVRWRSPRWPRFALGGLHRNLTLLAIAFVAAHVVTTVLDGYAPVRLVDAIVPFTSRYRPIWLGLGAVAFDLLLALVVTSLMRARLGFRMWKAVHWLAYASWPIALIHALGTGSDARVGFMLAVGLASIGTVVLAVLARAAFARDVLPQVRVGVAAAALLVPLGIAVWYQSGPAQHGWARRAGTPTTILARGRAVQTVARTTASTRLPSSRFSARLVGRVTESNAGNGLVRVVITGKLRGRTPGAVRIDLVGEPLQGGVTMTASGVSYVPGGTRTVYDGSVTTLAGAQVIATVSAGAGQTLQLTFDLNINSGTGSVTGTVAGSPVTSE